MVKAPNIIPDELGRFHVCFFLGSHLAYTMVAWSSLYSLYSLRLCGVCSLIWSRIATDPVSSVATKF